MLAELRNQELPTNTPELTVVARDGIVITPPLIDPSLIYLGRICPQLEIPLQALQNNREENPQFALGEEKQLLAYALWSDYPNATDQIAKLFQTTEKRVNNWIDHVSDRMEDAWDMFDKIQEQLKDEKDQKQPPPRSIHHLSSLWDIDKTDNIVPHTFVKTLGPQLGKAVAIAQTTTSYPDIMEQTHLTYGSARQRLYDARKKIEARVPELENFIKLKRSDHEIQRAIRFGNLEGFHIGNVWYGKKEDVEIYRLRIHIPTSYEDIKVSGDQKPGKKQPQYRDNQKYYPKGISLEEVQKNLNRRKK